MSMLVVGLSHHTAPLEVRERLAFRRRESLRLLSQLRREAGVGEAVLLSTCNRTELYLHPDPGSEGVGATERVLAARAGELGRPLPDYLYVHRGDVAVRHLFRVTSGLDALVVGESEIQGQVRDAYRLSAEVPGDPPMAGPVLHRLFQTALATGGRVRAETTLGQGSASVASVAVQLARKIFGSLRGRRVLILGAGETAELVVDAMSREGVEGVVVANRTYARATTLAERIGGRAVSLAEVEQALREADVVVASTAAPHPILDMERLAAALPQGVARPLLMIDLAVPRDIHPDVGVETNVFLYNVDDLRQIVVETLAHRQRAIPDAERIIDSMAAEFQAWVAAQEVVPLIRTLRDRGDRIRENELERLLSRLPDLAPEDRARVEEFSRRLLNKLLHGPTVRLRRGARGGRPEGLMRAARFLYGLDQESREGLDPTGESTQNHDDH